MKITSTKQILENCEWINPNLLVFDLYSEIFGKSFKVELDFNPQMEKKEIRSKTLESIIEFQNLTEKDVIAIQYSTDNGQTWIESKLEENLLHLGLILTISISNCYYSHTT